MSVIKVFGTTNASNGKVPGGFKLSKAHSFAIHKLYVAHA
jgi:hypothetical protein